MKSATIAGVLTGLTITAGAYGVDLSNCRMCHKEGGISPPIPAALYTSPHAALNCLDCHIDAAKPHKGGPTTLGCGSCHGDRKDVLAASAHTPKVKGTPRCYNCHGGGHYVVSLGVKKFQPSFARAVCGKCHPRETKDYLKSIHGKAAFKGDARAPNCFRCHGEPHAIESVAASTRLSFENVSDLCGSCHVGGKDTPHAPHPIPYPMVFLEKTGPSQKRGAPTELHASCVDCHTAHNEQPSQKKSSTVNISNVAVTCGRCHPREFQLYSMSIHGMAKNAGVAEAPVCTDCHSTYDKDKPAALAGKERMALCAECHDAPFMAKFGIDQKRVDEYKHTFHAKAIHYGLKSAADCVDCHTPHGVLPPTDERSTVSADNLIATCSASGCHTTAKASFAEAGGHLMDRGENANPVQKWTALFFTWLTRVVIGLLILHIIAEFTRDLPARLNARKNKERRMP